MIKIPSEIKRKEIQKTREMLKLALLSNGHKDYMKRLYTLSMDTEGPFSIEKTIDAILKVVEYGK